MDKKIYIFVFKNDLCYYFINFPFNFCTYFTVFNSFYAKYTFSGYCVFIA